MIAEASVLLLSHNLLAGRWLLVWQLLLTPTFYVSRVMQYHARMAHTQIYLGHIPTTSYRRRVLRERALRLAALLDRPELTPSVALLHVGEPPADLLLLRPRFALVGSLKDVDGPVLLDDDGRWITGAQGEEVRSPTDEPLLAHLKQVRDRTIAPLERHLQQPLHRTIGALIGVPSMHPDSQITLDIDDHRQQIKVLGLDELPALASMVQTGITLEAHELHELATDTFGGRLWHDGTQLLFEIGVTPWSLRARQAQDGAAPVWPLLEGATFVGRRRGPRRYEYRVMLADDELMSNDHAVLYASDDGRVVLRDTSTNGTWVALPGQPEQRLHRAERQLVAGTLLRMGATEVVLEHE